MSDHFDGKRFRNVAPFDEKGLPDLLRWKLLDGPAATWPDEIPVRATKPEPAAPTGRIRVTLVGHASTLLQMDGLNVLTDPVWSDTVGPVSGLGPGRYQPAGVRFDDLPPIHAVVISHSHFDHLDVPTLRRLAARHWPRIFAGLGTAAFLREQGIAGGEDLDWWQGVELGAVKLTMAPAQHWSQRGLFDGCRLLWGSYFFEGPSGRAYFGGDTGWGPHFAEIRGRLGAPDLALLPIGAYRPRWFMRSQHVSPDEAVEAHVALGARRSVAIHWGTFDQADEGAFEPVEDLWRALRQRGLGDDVFVARFNGGVVEAPPR